MRAIPYFVKLAAAYADQGLAKVALGLYRKRLGISRSAEAADNKAG